MKAAVGPGAEGIRGRDYLLIKGNRGECPGIIHNIASRITSRIQYADATCDAVFHLISIHNNTGNGNGAAGATCAVTDDTYRFIFIIVILYCMEKINVLSDGDIATGAILPASDACGFLSSTGSIVSGIVILGPNASSADGDIATGAFAAGLCMSAAYTCGRLCRISGLCSGSYDLTSADGDIAAGAFAAALCTSAAYTCTPTSSAGLNPTSVDGDIAAGTDAAIGISAAYACGIISSCSRNRASADGDIAA